MSKVWHFAGWNPYRQTSNIIWDTDLLGNNIPREIKKTDKELEKTSQEKFITKLAELQDRRFINIEEDYGWSFPPILIQRSVIDEIVSNPNLQV